MNFNIILERQKYNLVLKYLKLNINFLICFFLWQPQYLIAAPTYFLGDIKDTAKPTMSLGLSNGTTTCLPGTKCRFLKATALPNRVDWSSLVTPVKNQSNCSSCVVFATTAALESALLKEGKGTFNLSEQYGISCLLPSTYCSTGTQIGTYVNLLGSNGTSLRLTQYPYIAKYGSCNVIKTFLSPYNFSYNILKFEKISVKTVDDLKTALYAYGPVVVSFDVYSSFYSYTSGIYRPTVNEQIEGGHAVLVFGYDDLLGGFLAKNSWGTSWGKNGYFWMAYDQVAGMSHFGTRSDGVYAVTTASKPTIPRKYTYAIPSIVDRILN